MTVAGNHHADSMNLSPHSTRMLEVRDLVLTRWEQVLRSTVAEAKTMKHPVLINTLPLFYENIAKALTGGQASIKEKDAIAIAAEHGGERARLTNYNPEAVMTEFQLFRRTLLAVLNEHDIHLSHEELIIINNAVDSAVTEAVSAFALVQSALRERFAAALTHDLRNPLHSARMASEVILRSAELGRTKGLAVKIIENLDRMDGMIQSLLDAMVFQSGERLQVCPIHFDVLQLVREVQEESVIKHGRRFAITGEAVEGWWDRDALKRALENIVGNAIKYGDPFSTVTIKVENVQERLMLSVHNKGKGIPVDEQESIFQVYRRSVAAKEGAKQGWGIGLPYVRGVAESHGGSVGVHSSDEEGTTFFIDIPLDTRPFQDAPTFQAS